MRLVRFFFAGRMARRHEREEREFQKLETLQVRLRFHLQNS